jgi:uronate dehydrogenase
LVTGAAGRIGSFFAEHSCGLYDLRLMVRGDEAKIDEIKAYGEVVQCDLSDLGGLNRILEGMDSIVHLAADHRVDAPWEELLPNNIVGTYNVFAAAKAQGCRRVIFASSVNAIGSVRPDVQVRSSDPINPGNLYGVSKCFGEALCRYYAIREGVSSIALRIGGFQTLATIQSANFPIPRSMFVSPRDLNQLIAKCIDDETLQFAIFQGMSNNRYSKYDISDARELIGYDPVDDAFAETGG